MAADRLGIANGFGALGGTNLDEYIAFADRAQGVSVGRDDGERIVAVELDRIDRGPYQARIDFDPDELAALAADIARNGLTQPITLRPGPQGRYELVAGERRWLASRLAGQETIAARIRALDDFEAHLVGVSENNQRADLSAWEKAIEAFELRRHAEAAGRPCTQRDLASYLHRNVAIVNQQLAIAAAIPALLLSEAGLASRDVRTLPHELLHRISKLAVQDRPEALQDAIRMRSRRTDPPREQGRAQSNAPPDAEHDPSSADDWTRYWEVGGLRIHIRKPIRSLEPDRARVHLGNLLPGIGALATRAAECDEDACLVRWSHESAQILIFRPSNQLTQEQRHLAKEALADIISYLEAPS